MEQPRQQALSMSIEVLIAEIEEPYICKWCRADGVNLNEKKKETKVEKTKKEEEHVITRARTRQKKDGIGYI